MDKEDRISALPDDVLLGVIHLLDLRAAVRAGVLARRWRRLPRLLSDIAIDVVDLIPNAKNHTMAAYADAVRWLLAPTEHRTIKGLRLACYLAKDPDLLHSIGHAVAASTAERWEFTARTKADHRTIKQRQRHLLGPRFMSFVGACPVAFRRLTSLTLHNLGLRNSDIHQLLNASERLELLSLHRCAAVGGDFMSVLKIDAPTSSSLIGLELHGCYYWAVELTRVPNLERLLCYSDRRDWEYYFTVEFGHVPRLRDINLSAKHLRLHKHLTELSALFSNLRNIYLCDFNTHRVAWTRFILEAAPFLEKLSLELYQPWTDGYPYIGVVADENGGTPKFEHHNLVLLEMTGHELEVDIQVVKHIKLITERAVYLKRVRLLQQDLKVRSGVRSACPQELRSREALTDVLSSSIEVTVDRMT